MSTLEIIRALVKVSLSLGFTKAQGYEFIRASME
jgi:hypothetical protein